ncbi:unnamed protein product [Pleuronectes platessa]|uniref:Uncharacterized protein n=1 Tax=Pleuronectes platessa TaxID=8262 RepID=A0A9N7VXA7_PLEPL|nr:unnamed protein product [Pleuronectes platessa]
MDLSRVLEHNTSTNKVGTIELSEASVFVKQQQQVVGSDSFKQKHVGKSRRGAEPVEQQEAGHDLIHTGVGPHHQKIWNLLVRNMSGTFEDHLRNTSATHQEHVRNTSGTCEEYVRNI